MANLAIMGFGTVGCGVAEVLRMNGRVIEERLGMPLHLKYILDVRDLSGTPYQDLAVRDFGILEQDSELDVVVETIGGAKAALEFTRRALAAGKHVVTSNKELVAAHGRELLALAHEHHVSYLFEASVGGGIPVLRPLSLCLAGNQIQEIAGILNGTTNFILSRMIERGVDFSAALREAQANGYAERDPSADVEGLDACRKLCILCNLAWGREVTPESVCVQGISGLDLRDVSAAGEAGYAVKLLGRAKRWDDGRITAFVSPHLVPCDSPLASVRDVFNAVLFRGNAVGDVMFYGQGAGALPTASAVLGDVVEILSRGNNPRFLHWDEGASLADKETEWPLRWYLRGGAVSGVPGEPLPQGAFLTEPIPFREAEVLARQTSSTVLMPLWN